MPQADRHAYKATSVRFPFDLLQWIKAEAERTGQSVSAIVIGAVAEKRDHANSAASNQADSSSENASTPC